MEFDILGIVLRWMHMFAAIALFGGALYQRMVLMPGTADWDEPQRTALRDATVRRWSRVVMIAVLFLLVSGLANYILTIKTFKAPNPKLPGYYHMLFGIKFMLAFGIFFLASALSGRSEGMRKFRENSRTWLTVTLVLATILVGISGVMRSTHTGPNIEPPEPPQAITLAP